VAVFRGSTHTANECVLLLEAKQPLMGLAYARVQGEAYAEVNELRVPVVTTDGFVWLMFRDADDVDPLHAFLPDLTTSAKPFFDALIKQVTG
jgi:hypothetical protein